jgi:hypothetical protein
MRNKTMTKKPRTPPPEEDENVVWLSPNRHPKKMGWLMPDQRKKAWVEETFRNFRKALAPRKGRAKGGSEPND